MNAILGFRDYNAYLAFFEDADYQRIKPLYRDQAYEVLNLNLMQTEHHRYDADELSALLSASSALDRLKAMTGPSSKIYTSVTSRRSITINVVSSRRGVRGREQSDHQPKLPGTPLNGPTISWVIHPP